jgi:hypothetical protein
MNIHIKSHLITSKKTWIPILFISGIIFRFWIVSLIPQPLDIGDQPDYYRFAVNIIDKTFYVHGIRLYGYPLFLAFIFFLSGTFENQNAVIVSQIFMDTVTAFLVYKVGRNLFKEKLVALIALILYLFNPFSSAYTGVILTEVYTIFMITLIFYIFTIYFRKKRMLFVFILSLLSGYLPQIHPSFLILSFLYFLGLLYLLCKKTGYSKGLKIKYLMISILIYFIPFSYNLIGNYMYFGKPALMSINNQSVTQIYASIIYKQPPGPQSDRSAYLSKDIFPPEVYRMMVELTALDKNAEGRKMLNDKYSGLVSNLIRSDPSGFILSRFRKIRHVWEKSSLFYYVEPKNNLRSQIILIGNIFLQISGAAGFILWMKKAIYTKEKYNLYFGCMVFLFFLNITFVNVFTVAEQRYSLPFYPLLILYCGLFLRRFYNHIKFVIIRNKHDK